MAIDFAIEISGSDGQMTFGQTTTIMNNVYLSLMTERGSFFQDPTFGMRRRERMKNTERNANLVAADAKEALSWLIDADRATAIAVTPERDRSIDLCRLKLLVEVTQADGQTVTFEIFKDVA